jgi:hypothetical protein
MKYLFFILLSITILTGCTNDEEYPYAIAWNEVIYGRSNEEIPIQNIGKELGEIKQTRTPMPKKNEESNEKIVGSKLYEIQGENPQDKIALRINDKYFMVTKLSELK